jgi:hypothetical protein
MNMVWHDCPGREPVTLTVKTAEGILGQFGDGRLS